MQICYSATAKVDLQLRMKLRALVSLVAVTMGIQFINPQQPLGVGHKFLILPQFAAFKSEIVDFSCKQYGDEDAACSKAAITAELRACMEACEQH